MSPPKIIAEAVKSSAVALGSVLTETRKLVEERNRLLQERDALMHCVGTLAELLEQAENDLARSVSRPRWNRIRSIVHIARGICP